MNISVMISIVYIVLFLTILFNYVIKPKDIKETEKLTPPKNDLSAIQKWVLKIDRWARTHPKLLALIISIMLIGEVINIIKHYPR